MTMTHQRADEVLDEYLNDATGYMWLHTGDPGADGTANVAQTDDPVDIDRKALSVGSPENHPDNTERRVVGDGAVAWSGEEIDSGQNISHYSIWTAATDGTVIDIGAFDEAKETGGDGATIPGGEIEIAISVHVKPS